MNLYKHCYSFSMMLLKGLKIMAFQTHPICLNIYHNTALIKNPIRFSYFCTRTGYRIELFLIGTLLYSKAKRQLKIFVLICIFSSRIYLSSRKKKRAFLKARGVC